MKKALLLVLALTFLLSTQALASGSSGAPASASVPQDPLTVTETMKCIVTAVRQDGTVMVRDRKGEPEHPLRLTAKTRLSAQDKQAFDGRKKLDLADLAIGQSLRVTLRPATGEVTRIKVLKES